MKINELIDAAASAAVEQEIPQEIRDAFADVIPRQDGLYPLTESIFAIYFPPEKRLSEAESANPLTPAEQRASAFRQFNVAMARMAAKAAAEAAGLSGADVAFAGTKALPAARETINAAIERGDY